MASVNIKPMADRVVVEPLEETEEMRGGLYIPDTAKEKPQQGTVIAVGPGRRSDQGELIEVELSEIPKQNTGEIQLQGHRRADVKDLEKS